MFTVHFDELYLDDDGVTLVPGDASLEFDTLDEATAFINENPDCNPRLIG